MTTDWIEPRRLAASRDHRAKSRRWGPRLFTGTLLCGLALSHAALAAAGGGTTGQPGAVPETHTFSGSATYSIPIAVPAFFGVEPKLSLHYDSGGDGGWTGVGWSLSGLSQIERTGPTGGAPRYDSTDTFQLDGEPLVACTPQMTSPSCTTGGTHATKIESYRRIRYDAPTSTFHVWTTDGTESVYTAGLSTQHGVYRYVLSSTTDTHGNTVTFTWATSAFGQDFTHPVAIAYGGTAVQIHWEARPDVRSAALGPFAAASGSAPAAGKLEKIAGRIKAITVSTGGQKVRAYRLTYAQSVSSGRSLLADVQEVGRDFVVDASGAVTGGTTAPAHAFTYADAPSGGYSFSAPPLPAGYDTRPGAHQMADLDGDGKQDLVHITGQIWDPTKPSYADLWRSNGTGHFTRHRFSFGSYGTNVGQWLAVDVDADGKSDLVHERGWDTVVWLSKGDMTFTKEPAALPYTESDQRLTLPMDVNGDGRTDLVVLPLSLTGGAWQAGSVTVFLSTFKSDGSSAGWAQKPAFALGATYPLFGNNQPGEGSFTAGDVDGDGKVDLQLCSDGSVRTWRSKGDGTFLPSVAHANGGVGMSANDSQHAVLGGDFNGDGKSDLVNVSRGFAPNTFTTWLSKGDGTYEVIPFSLAAAGYPVYGTYNGLLAPGDVNGDGRTDILHLLGGDWGSEIYTWLGNGDGTFTLKWQGGLPPMTPNGRLFADVVATGDHSGDGKTDVVVLHRFWGKMVGISATGSAGNPVTQITTPLGGSFGFTYTPSSRYPASSIAPNQLASARGAVADGRTGAVPMPQPGVFQVVSKLVADDGRGTISQTDYAYSGALFDPLERRFLGFHHVKTTKPGQDPPPFAEGGDPCGPGPIFGEGGELMGGSDLGGGSLGSGPVLCPDGFGGGPSPGGLTARPYEEVYYKQGYGFVSMPEYEYAYGADGTLLRQVIHEYTTNGATIPYTQHETATWRYEYGDGGFARTHVARVFDAFGEPVVEIDSGDHDVPGNEVWTSTQYARNPAAFLSVPAARTVSTPDWQEVLDQQIFWYDGASDHAAVPVKGDRTATHRWLDTANGFVSELVSHDAHGNRTSVTDPAGATSTITYDPVHPTFPVAETSPLGHTVTRTWDVACGVELSVTDPNGAVTTREYDARCREIHSEGPLGAWRTVLYQNEGSPAAQRTLVLSPSADGVTDINVATYVDGLGRTYRTERDVTATSAGSCEHRSFHPDGSVKEIAPVYACAAGTPPAVDFLQYDGLGRLIAVHRADGTVTQQEHGLHRLASIDEAGHRVEDLMDARGNVIEHREWLNGTPHSLLHEHDLLGRRTRTVDPAGNVSTTTYDSLGRALVRHTPDLGTWTFEYDAAGREIRRTDAKGQIIETRVDKVGRPVAVGVNRPAASTVTITAFGTPVAGQYPVMRLWVDGAIVAQWTVSAAPAQYVYQGHVTGLVDVELTNDASAPPEDRDLFVTAMDVDGVSYSGPDAFVHESSGCGGVQPGGGTLACNGKLRLRVGDAHVFFYDQPASGASLGRATGNIDAAGFHWTSYDAAGRATKVTDVLDGVSYTFEHAHDEGGRLLGTRYPDGEVVGLDPATLAGTPLSYDAGGRLRSIPGIVNLAEYDAAGRLTRQVNANGTETTFTRSAQRGWLDSIETKKGGATLQRRKLTRDGRGLIVSIGESPVAAGNWTYAYDEMGRLLSASNGAGQSTAYTYDAIGNLLSANGTHYVYPSAGQPRPHAVASAGGASFAYDQNGNMTSGGGRTLSWDAHNRLASVTAGGVETTLVYDAAGQRRIRESDGVTTHHVRPDYEVTEGVVTRTFSLGERVVAQKKGAVVTWLHTDHQGSVELTTGATGAVTGQMAYAPYGAEVASTVDSPLGFTGERFDDDTGLLYLGARHYDPALGRFVSPDPTVPSDAIAGENRYAYAFNNPVGLTDRNGLNPWEDLFDQVKEWWFWEASPALNTVLVRHLAVDKELFDRWVERGVRFADAHRWTRSTLNNVMRGLQRIETSGAFLQSHRVIFRREEAPFAGGLTSGGSRLASIQLYLPDRYDERSVYATIHEYGHAIDYATGEPSSEAAWWRDAAGFERREVPAGVPGAKPYVEYSPTERTKQTAATNYHSSPSEAWAEAYAWYVNRSVGTYDMDNRKNGYRDPGPAIRQYFYNLYGKCYGCN